MTHIQRLREAVHPVHEGTTYPPKEHRVTIDRRDLEKLLADYDAAIVTLNDALLELKCR